MRPLSLALCLGLLSLPLAGAAEEPAPETTEPTPAESPAPPPSNPDAPLLHGQLALTLEDAIEMGLENNLDVKVERYAPVIAEYEEEIAWGAYDPEIFSEFGYADRQTPNSNVLFGTAENVNRSTDGFGGLRGVVPLLSTEYSGQFDGARRTTNSSIQALSPEYTSGWTLNLTQPLLRDLIWNQPWTQVKTTRLLMESSREDFRRAVMDTVSAIEGAYWSLIAKDEARRVAQKSLETARALLDQTKTQFEVGVVSKVEVTEAEAGLSEREVNLIRAENDYRNQQDVLIDLVLGPGLRSNSTLEIKPTDQPEEYVPYTIDVPTAVDRAFEHRPEIESAQKEIERQEVQLKFAKNQRLPALDGIFGFGESGLAGNKSPDFNACRFSTSPLCDPNDPSYNPNDPSLDPSQGGFGKTTDDYSDNPTFIARARFAIPFPNTAARKNVSKTDLELRRAHTLKKRLEQTIILEVRRAARNLEASQQAIDAARAAERAAQEQLRAERIRLEYGESTPFDVLQRERDLVDRENELIGAFQAYRTSVTALDRAQGTILRNRNIKIAEVSPLR